MNWAVVLMLSGVIFLGGCVQNESQPSETPAGISEIADITHPADVDVSASNSPLSVKLKDGVVSSNFADSAVKNEANLSVTEIDENSDDAENEFHVANLDEAKTKAPIHIEGATPAEKSQERLLPTENTSGAPVVVAKDQKQPEVTTTGSALVKPQTVDVNAITASAAYTGQLLPLFQKIRSLHADTAMGFEKLLKGGKLYAEDAKALTSAEASPEVQAQNLFQAIVVTQAILDNEADESKVFNELYQRAKIMSANLLKNRDRLNTRFLYNNLVFAKLSIENWKFETLTAIEASSVVLSQGMARFRFMKADPEDSFSIREPGKVMDNCRLSIVYQGAEKGTLIRVSEPEWREFEIAMDFQKPTQEYSYRPSLVGEQYKELEVLSAVQALDKTSFKMSLRFVDQKKEGQTASFRRLDHVLLEKISADGKSERALMCRVLTQ